MKKKDNGSKTLLTSILMSAPGPLIIGLGLISSHSLTQLADFVRRFSELLAIILAYIIFQLTNQPQNNHKKASLERFAKTFTSSMMILGGIIMIILALCANSSDKGNVISGFIIALLGVIANGIFWRRYTHLAKQENYPILKVQASLYRAKTLVDSVVTITFIIIMCVPHSNIASIFDQFVTIFVALYLIWSGYTTLKE